MNSSSAQGRFRGQIHLLLAGVAYLAVMQPVGAETASAEITDQDTTVSSAGDRPLNGNSNGNGSGSGNIGSVPYLGEIDLPPTTVEAWTQEASRYELAQSSVSQIIGVEVQETETGIEILLETADGQLAVPVTTTIENALIADIPNAALNLSGENEFQATAPAPGIAQVAVVSLSDRRDSVAITGIEGPPAADIRTIGQGLVLSVTPGVASGTTAEAIAPLRILVTAQRTEEDVQDVPISISVLTGQQVEDSNIDTFRGAADRVPNYTVFDATGSRFFDYYSIRGLSNFNFSSRDAVGFFIDDVPYDYGGFITQDLTDVERIEVLRGPQSTLYGRSSQAGAINVITRRPTNTFEFKGALSYGSFNNLQTQASVSGPAIEDQLFLRLSGSYGVRDGYYENTFLDDSIDDEWGGNIRGQVLWTPSEEWEILLNAAYDGYTSDGLILASVDSDPFEQDQDLNGIGNLDTNTQSLRVAYNGPNLRVTSITTRRYSKQDLESDLDQSILSAGSFTNKFTSTVFSQELRLQSPETAEQLKWLAGAYYESRSFNTDADGFNFGPDATALFGDFGVPGGASLRFADIDEDLFAVFGQVSYDLTDDLTVTAGLRYETITSTLDSFERIFSTPGLPDQVLVEFNDVEESGDVWLPRATIEYRFSPEVMVYGSIARGYRPGGVNFRPDNEDTLSFEAERSWNFEVGLKSSWLDNRLGLNLAVFHNPVENYQVISSDPISFLPTGIVNADVSITGFEVEARATPFEGFDITAGFGLADANFTDYPGRSDFDGNAVPFAPEFTYNLGLQYRSPIGIFGRVELSGLGTTFYDEANTVQQDPYALVNARLGYESDHYGIYVFANNIFDTEYLTFASPFGDSALGLYGVPATVGVQFRAKF